MLPVAEGVVGPCWSPDPPPGARQCSSWCGARTGRRPDWLCQNVCTMLASLPTSPRWYAVATQPEGGQVSGAAPPHNLLGDITCAGIE